MVQAGATDGAMPSGLRLSRDKSDTAPSGLSVMSDEELRPYFNEVMRRKMKLRRANRKES
jgi:hypothetical protein